MKLSNFTKTLIKLGIDNKKDLTEADVRNVIDLFPRIITRLIIDLINKSSELKNYISKEITIEDVIGCLRVKENIIPHYCQVCGKKVDFDFDHNLFPKTCSKECKGKLSYININKYLNSMTEDDKLTRSLNSALRNPDIRSIRTKNDLDRTYLELFDKYKDVTPMFTRELWFGYKNKTNSHVYKWKCNLCGCEFESIIYCGISPRCVKCYPKTSSCEEVEFRNYIKSIYKGEVLINRKIVPPYELDIYIPEYKIGFEYNGLFHHREEHPDKIGREYHKNKFNAHVDSEIDVIQILDSDWMHSVSNKATKDFILKILNPSKLVNPIYSNSFIITKEEAIDFSLKNSKSYEDSSIIQNDNLFLGIGDKNSDLLAIICIDMNNQKSSINAVIGKIGYNIKYDIIDMPIKSNVINRENIEVVINNRFINRFIIKDLESIGFKFDRMLEPKKFYFKSKRLIDSNDKESCVKLINEKYNEKISLYENMINNGFYTFLDSGYSVFI